MGRPLAITKRQATTLLKAAEEQHAIVEIKTAIGVVRLIPQSVVKETEREQDEFDGHF
jgi:hypothetical protein